MNSLHTSSLLENTLASTRFHKSKSPKNTIKLFPPYLTHKLFILSDFPNFISSSQPHLLPYPPSLPPHSRRYNPLDNSQLI